MNNGNFLKEIINYLESNYLIFLVAYILVVIVQLIVLYKKNSGMRIILFSVHKIIAFVAIAYLLLYSKNILGFYLYVIGVVTLAFSCSIIKKEKIEILELFLMGDINLIVALLLILFKIK
ncbi:hypothetical protein [Fusobacterium pseudoperiodonticum]|uniref:Uncharacterized protein n=1 Tax=Fusobacterium pseudoperiodonticum TaxID=2663009 RepID=A0A2D3NUX9_9FUSO|nr:hypothetical protein [Fusobacterium pseudoperiodonticum]ATV59207.1 hypothetical protein CTM72_05225 [Fusobacterium pseudoperiodonticum]